MIMRIMIRDPFSSLPISNSPIASASASDEDTSPSTSGGGGGDPPAWTNDSASASVTLTLSSAPSTISQSTFTSASSGVAVIVPVQVSSTNPAQVSSTSSAGSITPTGFASTSSSLSHNSRKGAIAGGIVGGISVLLLGFALWFFRRCARKRASMRRGRGGDAGEKPDGVVGPKDDKSTGNANPQERETGSAIASLLPNSNVPAMPQTEIATPIPPTTSDSTAGSPLPNSNVPVILQTGIATPIPPTTSDPTASWKYYITALPEMPLMSSKVVFAVDASDSTAGPVMQRQQEFVLAMVEDYQLPHSVIMWGCSVEQPKSAAQICWDRHRE
ncbi:hypothetical protein B0H14DRAFT_2586595 [Mycena olivaceomarginata]|nr:hypothetical protein B0H14DRAFT_2586595 [Mycena olivaceomarginata]